MFTRPFIHTFLFACAILVSQVALFAAPIQLVQIPAGTMVALETNEALGEAQIVPGQIVQLLVREDVISNNIVVIAAGASGLARIASVESGDEVTAGYCLLEPFNCTAVDGQTIALEGAAIRIDSESPGAHFSIEAGLEMRSETLIEQAVEMADSEQVEVPSDPITEQLPDIDTKTSYIALPAGMDIPLVLSDECIPANLVEGGTVRLRVREDVIIDNQLVIRAKAPATGRIKYLKEGQIFIVATTVTATDGMLLPVETDNSVKIEYAPEQEEELLQLKVAVPAQLVRTYQVRVR